MPRKVNYPQQWIPPTVEEIQEAVDALGGKSDTCRILCKNYNTINRWYNTGKGIDKANWEYMMSILSK